MKLDSHHQATLEKIFRHPTSHNIEWHDVLSLLESVASVSRRHDGRFAVTLGAETEILDAPRHDDIDEQLVVDLRRMLRGAGITPD
jgi:thiamine biosynthesis lipoprotein ApbE